MPEEEPTIAPPPAKRLKMEELATPEQAFEKYGQIPDYRERMQPPKGVAWIKEEYLIQKQASPAGPAPDDDAAEQSTYQSSGVKDSYGTPKRADQAEAGNSNDRSSSGNWKKNPKAKWSKDGGKKRETGQNKNRQFGSWGDVIQLCITRQNSNEFSPEECSFGDRCKKEHDLRKYLETGKEKAQTTFDGKCPVYEELGYCPVGWKCRWVDSHSEEKTHEDGRKELVLHEDPERMKAANVEKWGKNMGHGVYNNVSTKEKIDLERRRVDFPKSDAYTKWLNDTYNPLQMERHNAKPFHGSKYVNDTRDTTREGEKAKTSDAVNQSAPSANVENGTTAEVQSDQTLNDGVSEPVNTAEVASNDKDDDVNGAKVDTQHESKSDEREDHRSSFKDPPFRASEKRRLYYGADTPVLAPLTTQGNLPFRRICVGLGAQVTWSEMAQSFPLIQGQKAEWPLVKAHQTEVAPPTGNNNEYNWGNKFGVQIAANKPWMALKATEILAKYCPTLRAIDLNCGCPIDQVFETGGGSALMGTAPRLEKMLRGMNAVSNDIPITVKIRMGIKDNDPTAKSLVDRLVLGGQSAQEDGLGACGVGAITLHGRSRQQRYTRSANWEYIAEVAATIKDLRTQQDALADTIRESDARDQPNGGKVYFCGNGDVYSHVDYNTHMQHAGVDSCMIARGALIKPWVFEEIATNSYIDKSATERLGYIEQFCRHGLDHWGSDETGVGTTRRFLLEWLSFTHRYVPLGLLERLPPQINERPPPFVGRNELETLLASKDYRDWIKISEMFLGPAHERFKFTPKHKSNAYENIEAEG